MLTHIKWLTALCHPRLKHMYINGYFCYSDKLSIITNYLGIIRHIAFMYDDELQKSLQYRCSGATTYTYPQSSYNKIRCLHSWNSKPTYSYPGSRA